MDFNFHTGSVAEVAGECRDRDVRGRLAGPGRGLHREVDRTQLHSHCATVRNITLSVDDSVYRAARVEAARRNTSVSGVVRAYLQAFAMGRAPMLDLSPDARGRQERQKLVKLLRGCKLRLGYKPSRARTYEGGRFSRF